jgi:hypothetical protein
MFWLKALVSRISRESSEHRKLTGEEAELYVNDSLGTIRNYQAQKLANFGALFEAGISSVADGSNPLLFATSIQSILPSDA